MGARAGRIALSTLVATALWGRDARSVFATSRNAKERGGGSAFDDLSIVAVGDAP